MKQQQNEQEFMQPCTEYVSKWAWTSEHGTTSEQSHHKITTVQHEQSMKQLQQVDAQIVYVALHGSFINTIHSLVPLLLLATLPNTYQQ
jgi:hypothetical protein